MAQAQGKYQEAAREGRLFDAANQSAAALTAAFATTYTGLVISNPVSNTKLVSLLKCGFTLSVVASAATTIGLMTGANPTAQIAASITPRTCYVGSGNTGTARVSASVDLAGATPVLDRIFAQVGTLATTGTAVNPTCEIELDGSILLAPGAYCAFYSTSAFTAAFYGYFLWEEIPLT